MCKIRHRFDPQHHENGAWGEEEEEKEEKEEERERKKEKKRNKLGGGAIEMGWLWRVHTAHAEHPSLGFNTHVH